MTDIHKVAHLSPLERVKRYVVNFVFNGMLGMFVMILFVWFILPTKVFFEYDTVSPVIQPVDITKDYIEMASNIKANHTNGNFHWNDVLRCNYEMDPDGFFQYIGQSDSFVETSKIRSESYVAPWSYTGKMPHSPALCTMNSTITRYVLGYIPKQQFVVSKPFVIE